MTTISRSTSRRSKRSPLVPRAHSHFVLPLVPPSPIAFHHHSFFPLHCCVDLRSVFQYRRQIPRAGPPSLPPSMHTHTQPDGTKVFHLLFLRAATKHHHQLLYSTIPCNPKEPRSTMHTLRTLRFDPTSACLAIDFETAHARGRDPRRPSVEKLKSAQSVWIQSRPR
jgi:hypothetical protein